MSSPLTQVISYANNWKEFLLFTGLRHERRPTWLALIILFFSDRTRDIWTRLAAGILIGIACDQLTSNEVLARL